MSRTDRQSSTLQCTSAGVEEKILDLQATKRALADAILGQDQGVLAGIGREELEALLA